MNLYDVVLIFLHRALAHTLGVFCGLYVW